MADHLTIHSGNKAERYATLLPQLTSIVAAETDPIANMANIAACLWETFHFWWVGFYRVMGDELVLGPFKDHSLAHAFAKGAACVAQPGQRRAPSSCPT